MDPGPQFPSILNLQAQHRSSCIWDGEDWPPLTCRTHLYSKSKFTPPEPVVNFIRGTQFYGTHRLSFVPIYPYLVTALVERWRQETHTFHFPIGEVGITLQDVNVLLGLKVGGLPITGSGEQPWAELLEHYLGIAPPKEALKGKAIKLSWLAKTFQHLPDSYTEQQLHCYVRAYLLYLIGAVLFPDKSGNRVQLIYFQLLIDLTRLGEYSWGSGVLAYLYRNLCVASKKGALEISGCLVLLQLWSWERLTIGRPTSLRSLEEEELGTKYPLGSQMQAGFDPFGCKWLRVKRTYNDHQSGLVGYRHALDCMTESMFTWQPYTQNVLSHLPDICSEDVEEWIVNAPLICFEIVEWHFAERVVRQFGLHPEIPVLCETCEKLHGYNRRGKEKNYESLNKLSIERWMNRKRYLVPQGAPYSGYISYTDPYMTWYRSITRLIISPQSKEVQANYESRHYYYPTAAEYSLLTQASVFNYNHASSLLASLPDDASMTQVKMIYEMKKMSLQSLQNTRQGHLIHQEPQDENEEEEEEEEYSQHNVIPRYDFRHLEHRATPSQDEDMSDGSTSQRRTKRGRSGRN